MAKYLKLVVSIAICLIVGFLGSLLTTPSIKTWYVNINKPSFNPPNWLFGPVWTVLFILIGISFYEVWVLNFGTKKTLAISIFALNLILNLLWSLLFFYLKTPLLALVDLIALWIAILINIFVFYGISKPAGILLIPYLLWVSFAGVLNYYIYVLNR